MNVPDLDYDAIPGPERDDVAWLALLGGGEPRSLPYRGVKALMLAVLEDGIRAYLGSSPLLRTEAEQWMRLRQRRWPFSFSVVCETLGLEPSAVQRALRIMRAQKALPAVVRRSRPHAGHRRTRAQISPAETQPQSAQELPDPLMQELMRERPAAFPLGRKPPHPRRRG